MADPLTPARASEIRRRLDEYAVALNNVSGNGEAWGAPDEAAVRAFTQHAAADLRALLDFYEAAVPLLREGLEMCDQAAAEYASGPEGYAYYDGYEAAVRALLPEEGA